MICICCGKEFRLPKHNPYSKTCSHKCSSKIAMKNFNGRQYQADKRKEVKEEILKLLGGKCVKCGYIGRALQIDHINGGGKIEILTVKNKGSYLTYMQYILNKIKNGSKDYQLLCANHNIEKFYGVSL